MQGLFRTLSAFHALSADLKNAIADATSESTLPKNELLLTVHNVSSNLYYLEDGYAMAYSYHEGRKITQNFWRPGQIILSLESFFRQKPSREAIQLLERSTVLYMGHEAVMALTDRYREMRYIMEGLAVYAYTHVSARLHDVQFSSVKERFDRLIREHPGVERVASQEAIASYIGITGQSLARMKRKRR